MDILAFALTEEYVAFTISFALMCLLAFSEAARQKLGYDSDTANENVASKEIDSTWAATWMGISNDMPIILWASSMLGCYGLSGFAIQFLVIDSSGYPLSGIAAMNAAIIPAVLMNVLASNALNNVFSKFGLLRAWR